MFYCFFILLVCVHCVVYVEVRGLSQFSSGMYVPGIRLRPLGLEASAFRLWAILTALGIFQWSSSTILTYCILLLLAFYKYNKYRYIACGHRSNWEDCRTPRKYPRENRFYLQQSLTVKYDPEGKHDIIVYEMPSPFPWWEEGFLKTVLVKSVRYMV